ncbi:hypothetical protein DM860_014066 [Cuscuta australis]|uniref:Uncharacterized protein n=1 Tax=Cuscuta australis TaxID=267555 RepID=A0A328DF89_9ASTE|nr:hypothetical protein DM860_014066 [Cuscuta australis]
MKRRLPASNSNRHFARERETAKERESTATGSPLLGATESVIYLSWRFENLATDGCVMYLMLPSIVKWLLIPLMIPSL